MLICQTSFSTLANQRKTKKHHPTATAERSAVRNKIGSKQAQSFQLVSSNAFFEKSND